MSTFTLKAVAAPGCSGGGHAVINVTGDMTFSLPVDVDRVIRLLQEAEKEDAVVVVLRMALIGRTPAQLHTLLTSPTGLVVTA